MLNSLMLMVLLLLVQAAACRIVQETSHGPVGSQRPPSTVPLWQRPLPGGEPEEPPQFDVSFEVPEGVSGYPLVIHVRERHGYYVETFQIRIKKKSSDYQLELFYDRVLRAGGVLTLRERLVPRELPKLGGTVGTGDDWEGVVTDYGRARATDPDPLPVTAFSPEPP